MIRNLQIPRYWQRAWRVTSLLSMILLHLPYVLDGASLSKDGFKTIGRLDQLYIHCRHHCRHRLKRGDECSSYILACTMFISSQIRSTVSSSRPTFAHTCRFTSITSLSLPSNLPHISHLKDHPTITTTISPPTSFL